MSSGQGTALRGLALVLVCLAIVTVRVVWSSRVQWRAAQSASGDERIAALGRAARLYAPGNPYARRALASLTELGRAGGPDALAAFREVRSAILATRSFYTPHRALLEEANQRIAQLSAAGEPDSRGTPAEREAWHAARLAQDDSPSVPWTLVALAGLAGWVGAAFGFFLRGTDEHDRLRPRPALAWAVGVVAGLTLFFLGLARA
jgi:hypothetical protein